MRKLLYINILFSALAFVGCTKDFEDINTNQNAPVSVEPEFLLRQVSYDFAEEMSYEGFVAGNLLSQHFAMVDFNLFDRHSLSEPQLGGNPWPFIYTNLRDNEILLAKSQETSVYDVYEGPALVLKAYFAMALTDIYGDAPYFEAFRAKEGIINPKYSSQENIYMAEGGILDNLRKASTFFENYTGGNSLAGDIIFNGDLSQWAKFANSLRIKALMRISSKMDVSTELTTLVNAGNYIAENADNAVVDFTDGKPNNFRMANLRDGDFNLYTLSLTSEEILNDLGDPRIATFYRTENDTSSLYRGILNGRNASNSISLDSVSLTGTIFRENAGVLEANYLTAWETNFLIAEAIERGYVTGSAKSFYDKAVQQAFDYWNTTMPTDYLTTGNAAYGANGANTIEQIITQKWIAQIINGYEAWIEWRRTGFPALKTIEASLNNNLIPVRMPYPTDEEALNAFNYQQAAANTDGNSVNAPVWWDE
ncbi:SusD/RagB family nutrient-binding outer membrane lipoprotein [Luteibaculum oceani]|uniref:SusD/RagB family nutrient-binding outer membrane lipoprotein n=1 Tax=Luteibaculum oceani TaxID=1294296 RepID=A0A5C6VB03_9FLAO|nr:SusD/RagB family nutrient-binding outer membrane lipoprotein [Luteibaculum oceani]TXC82080.1 SusD/RagB family nutrient-binding outer membrane lipoprotein [Luteibaculum oceani]